MLTLLLCLRDSDIDVFPVAVRTHKRNMTGQVPSQREACILCTHISVCVFRDSDIDTFPVAVGTHKRNMTGQVASQREACILCQEEQDIVLTNKAMVLTAFVQK